jgi:protein-L-isoaspartate(D-aspartate) O-methyltransferase
MMIPSRMKTILFSPPAGLALAVFLLCSACPGPRPADAMGSDPSPPPAAKSGQADHFRASRLRMVEEQIEARGVGDGATLQAMRHVPRHLYVPERFRESAYEDGPLPIGYGQTISQPYIVAFMTETIRPESDFRVLEIGTDSGYQAAVLAEIVAEVLTIEIVPELAQSADSRLREQGYTNVQTRLGDGFDGWPEKAPFDAIIVTAAAEFIPPPLLDQLKEGGRMIIPVGSPFFLQTLVLVEKREGKITTQSLLPVSFVPLLRGETSGNKKDD